MLLLKYPFLKIKLYQVSPGYFCLRTLFWGFIPPRLCRSIRRRIQCSANLLDFIENIFFGRVWLEFLKKKISLEWNTTEIWQANQNFKIVLYLIEQSNWVIVKQKSSLLGQVRIITHAPLGNSFLQFGKGTPVSAMSDLCGVTVQKPLPVIICWLV